jgi:glycosyltransferase involved in cell wall biosynthesis
MHTIVHISADFPDPLAPAKTKAVENLIGATPGLRHVVYSLNRVSWRTNVASISFGEDRVALAYGAPPFGIGLQRYLRPVTDAIRRDLTNKQIMPDLIHAHKFSVEGLVAADLAESENVPFAASLWGDTDIKIFEGKPRLQSHYRQIARRAAALLPAAPWTQRYFEEALGLAESRFRLLPVITAADEMLPPVTSGVPRLVSVFSLDAWRRKNLDTLASAISFAARSLPDVSLDIFGGGGAKSFFDAKRVIRKAGMEGRIRLMGSAPHGRVQKLVNSYAAFVLTPRRETYGMVHVEALLAGVPMLWSQGRGIDGLVNGFNVGYRCDPSSAEDIAKGIKMLIRDESILKQRIARLQDENAFDHLRRAKIASRYREILNDIVASPVQSRSPISVGMR